MAAFGWNSAGSIQHFSHPHLLELTTLEGSGAGKQYYCRGCIKSLANEFVYQCMPCNFYLHLSCAQIPRQITHPADNHVLNLLSQPCAYGTGLICTCNACGQKMRHGFSFHCSICQLDLHPSCANLPMKYNHQHHEQHTLTLYFNPPYEDKSFTCCVCNKHSKNSWHYHCSECLYDVHVTCTQISSLRERLMNQFVQDYSQDMMGMGSQRGMGNPIFNQIVENHTREMNRILENFTGNGNYLRRSYSEPPRFSPFAQRPMSPNSYSFNVHQQQQQPPSVSTNPYSFHVHQQQQQPPSMSTNPYSFHVNQQQQQPPFPSAYGNTNHNGYVQQGMEAIMQNVLGGSGIPGGDVSGILGALSNLGDLSGIIGSMFGFGFF